MGSYTEKLKLFKYDPSTDGNVPFSIQQALNDNWDKIDALKSGKQDTLVSGTNIKTINNQSILGGGNIAISSPSIYLKTAYVNGTSGYNIWSNGYCEQWGRTTRKDANDITTTLVKNYSDKNYNILIQQEITSNQGVYAPMVRKDLTTVNSFTYHATHNITVLPSFQWKTSGYLASGQY